MKLLRAIQLDASDRHVYEQAATPGEWVIPASFVWWDLEPRSLRGKARQAFATGFLGTESFGWTSLTMIADASEADCRRVIERLAAHLERHYGAPDTAAARAVAEQELEFANSLCEHPVNTLIAVQRELTEDGIAESFRVVQPPSGAEHQGVRLWGAVGD